MSRGNSALSSWCAFFRHTQILADFCVGRHLGDTIPKSPQPPRPEYSPSLSETVPVPRTVRAAFFDDRLRLLPVPFVPDFRNRQWKTYRSTSHLLNENANENASMLGAAISHVNEPACSSRPPCQKLGRRNLWSFWRSNGRVDTPAPAGSCVHAPPPRALTQ